MNTIKHLRFCTRNQLESSGTHGTAQSSHSLPALTQAVGLEPLAGTGTGVSAGDSDGAGGCLLSSFKVMPESMGKMALGQNIKGTEIIHHCENSKYRVTRG